MIETAPKGCSRFCGKTLNMWTTTFPRAVVYAITEDELSSEEIHRFSVAASFTYGQEDIDDANANRILAYAVIRHNEAVSIAMQDDELCYLIAERMPKKCPNARLGSNVDENTRRYFKMIYPPSHAAPCA